MIKHSVLKYDEIWKKYKTLANDLKNSGMKYLIYIFKRDPENSNEKEQKAFLQDLKYLKKKKN